MTKPIRQFDTGATRDSETGKYDFEGFLSVLALERYAAYMNQHRVQADGKLRDSDNWQRGMGLKVYIKSAWRHFFDWWKIHRGYPVKDRKDGHAILADEAICALIFNAFGYLHEYLKVNQPKVVDTHVSTPGGGPVGCGIIDSDGC